MDKVATILVHWNPVGYRRLVDNYYRCLDGLIKNGANVITVEAGLNGRYELEGPTVIRLPYKSVMWQKERLINYAASILPSKFEYVAWVDADLLFDVPDWQAQAVRQLESGKFGFVQCHSHVLYLPRNHLRYMGATDYECECVGYHIHQTGGNEAWRDLQDSDLQDKIPGGAWMSHRAFFELGLYDRHIVGGNDSCFVGALTNFPRWKIFTTAELPALRADVDHYERLLWGSGLNLKIGYVPGSCFHLWHGNPKRRGYGAARNKILIDNQFDPLTDIKTVEGVLEWASDKPDLHERMKAYFSNRQEDQ